MLAADGWLRARSAQSSTVIGSDGTPARRLERDAEMIAMLAFVAVPLVVADAAGNHQPTAPPDGLPRHC